MNVVHFGEGACEKIRRYLDSYISNELLVETNHEVLRHLDHCPSCSTELDVRTRIRTQLKTAVQNQPVPPDLQARVLDRIRSQPARHAWQGDWTRWVVAVAAVLVIGVGTYVAIPRWSMPSLSDRPGQDQFIQRVSETVSAVLRVGLGDHIHCSVFRKYPQNPPTLDQMAQSMGPAYSKLVPLIKASIPDDYRIVMAHQCGYKGRRFVHVTLQNDSNLISLVIARKQNGESLASLSPSLRPSGIPVYQSAAQRYEVAAFETDQHLAFVVSDLSGKKNLQIAAGLAPAVHEFLSRQQG
jgi:anti-sigma factor (TIGR02949 family)